MTPLNKLDAVLYGHFINAAYAMYDASNPDPLRPARTDDFPSGFDLTAWIQMSDFAFGGDKQVKFYGYVARDKQNPCSHVIVIRGTEGWIEWYDDAVAIPQRFSPVPTAGDVSSHAAGRSLSEPAGAWRRGCSRSA